MTDAARPATAYALTPEQEATLELADKFGRVELAPLSRKMDDEEWWPPRCSRSSAAPDCWASRSPPPRAAPASTCSRAR